MNLQTLHKTLTTPERKALADAAGIKPEYLWQLANGWKTGPSLSVITGLCKAEPRLHLVDLVAEFDGRKHIAATVAQVTVPTNP